MDSSQRYISFLPDFCGTRMVFVVVLLAELLAVVLTLARIPGISSLLYTLALHSLFIQWTALSCTAVLCLCRPYVNHLPDHWVATLSYLITLCTSLLVIELAWWIFNVWLAGDHITPAGHAMFLLCNMGISAIACAIALRYFYVVHQLRSRIKSEADARYQALQSRIRPHFLFNCMNTIASLVRREPVLAEQAVEDLSDLFRAALGDARLACTLQEEIDLCKGYLRIEQNRLHERLTVIWDIGDLPMDLKLPVLCIQPLLENAIYHGIENLPDGGTIHIKGNRRNKAVSLTIENPVLDAAINPAIHPGNHLAQDNIRQRLAAVFDLTNPLQVTRENGLYRVTLIIPYPDENTDR
jgi:two-component system sensor histidine kinase AlgZ